MRRRAENDRKPRQKVLQRQRCNVRDMIYWGEGGQLLYFEISATLYRFIESVVVASLKDGILSCLTGATVYVLTLWYTIAKSPYSRSKGRRGRVVSSSWRYFLLASLWNSKYGRASQMPTGSSLESDQMKDYQIAYFHQR